MMNDPYMVLGVSRTATQREITRAYRRHLRNHHPDLHPGVSDPDTNELLHRIIAAYTLLRDPARRAEYDRDFEVAQNNSVRIRVGTDAVQKRHTIRITVNRDISERRQPPLWAAPPRWHRSR